MRIRAFAAADLAPVVALWNRCLTKDPITAERFWRLFLLDDNFDPAGLLVAADGDGRIVGFLQAIARRVPLGDLGVDAEQGWLTVFCVAPEYRRQGVGTRLLEAGRAFLRAAGRVRVSVNGYAPHYVFPGVDVDYGEAHAFLTARGFAATSEPVAMGMALEGVRTPEEVRARRDALVADGHAFRPFLRDDTLPLLAFAAAHFPHWRPSLLDGLQRGHTEILLALRHTEIVGFVQWQNPHNDPPDGAPGRFGPFGIHPDLRSQGIGASLFWSQVERAQGEGARYLWFGWAGGRNVAFYERAGCRVTRRFRMYAALMNEGV